jgi:hypothetical protein
MGVGATAYLIMDGPPAMLLGVDPVSHDAMSRPRDRPASAF